MGPVEYVCTASDLRAVSPTNFLCKYDDTYLIVPASNTSLVPNRLQHITDWAYTNNLKLNNHKSFEMIGHQAWGRNHANEPAATPGINRVDKLTILGVTVSNTLTFNHHITSLIEKPPPVHSTPWRHFVYMDSQEKHYETLPVLLLSHIYFMRARPGGAI